MKRAFSGVEAHSFYCRQLALQQSDIVHTGEFSFPFTTSMSVVLSNLV